MPLKHFRYEVAVGTTKGGAQLREFREVSLGATSAVIHLDLYDIKQVKYKYMSKAEIYDLLKCL